MVRIAHPEVLLFRNESSVLVRYAIVTQQNSNTYIEKLVLSLHANTAACMLLCTQC